MIEIMIVDAYWNYRYKDNHEKEISTPAFAQLLSNTLYMRRLFPYYTFNVIGGIDENGKGAVYTYDAVGSFERVECTVQGAGTQHMMPLLDSLVSDFMRLGTCTRSC
eukprot:gb/GECG01011643.1/.p1 GENE.gb/GECG01011643.1/~~gb/GECG01011643.1/.p1  ORF type:complete len:107 (+),score=8.85 gb/GECG01011643.1/:1-321(+)